jgi:hypothetical protein
MIASANSVIPGPWSKLKICLSASRIVLDPIGLSHSRDDLTALNSLPLNDMTPSVTALDRLMARTLR